MHKIEDLYAYSGGLIEREVAQRVAVWVMLMDFCKKDFSRFQATIGVLQALVTTSRDPREADKKSYRVACEYMGLGEWAPSHAQLQGLLGRRATEYQEFVTKVAA